MKVYNADQVKIIVGGIPVDSGMGSDEVCRIEKDEDDIVTTASADGESAISVNNNTWHTVTLTCKKTSAMNAVLSGMHKAGRLLPQGVFVLPIVVVDSGSNGDLFASHKAVMLRMPNESYSREIQEIEWAFKVAEPERFIGGH